MSETPVLKDEPATAVDIDSASRSSSSNNSDDSDGEEEELAANKNDAAKSNKRTSTLTGDDEKKAKLDDAESPELNSSLYRESGLDEVISLEFLNILSANQAKVSSSHEFTNDLFDRHPYPNIELYKTELGTKTGIEKIQERLSLIQSHRRKPPNNGDDIKKEQIEGRMVELEALTSVHNQFITDAQTPKEIQLTLDPLQRKFDDRISELINDLSPGTLECVRLRGPPGSGKTTLFEHIAKSEKSVSVFVSPTNFVNDRVSSRLPSVQTYTFFKLISLFFYEQPPPDHFGHIKNLLSSIETFDREKLRDLYEYSGPLLADETENKVYAPEALVRNKDKPLTIFFDDISSLTETQVTFSMMLLRRFCEDYSAYVILILFCDFHQVPPIFNTNTEIQHGFFMERDLIETGNDFELDESNRLEDSYMDFLNSLWKIDKEEILDEMRSYFTEKCFNRKIEYSYPGVEVAKMFELFRNKSEEFTCRLPALCESILKYRVFAYRNRDAYHHMLLFAFMIYSQSENYVDFHFPIDFSDSNHSVVPVVPLIRFFPYRFVGQSRQIPRLAIVHLIDWNDNNCCCFYPPERKLITLNKEDFCSNLLTCQFNSEVELTGFPLELDYASTVHASRGRTLTNSIIVHLPYMSREELYASLSQIRNKEGLFTFFH